MPLFSLRRHSFAVVLLALTASGVAQPAAQPSPESSTNTTVRVFHLNHVAQTAEASDITTALRNVIDPHDQIYLVMQTNDVVVRATPEQLDLIAHLLTELDRPKHTYRLTYTLSEADSGKRVGVQHFSMVVVTGQRVSLKQGDKVPLVTGTYNSDKASSESQVTYIDVGINLDSTLDDFSNGLRLRSKVEQSSVGAGQQSGKLADDPVVRQSVLEGTSVITPGKPLNLGGIDLVGSTRHIDIEVLAEPLN